MRRIRARFARARSPSATASTASIARSKTRACQWPQSRRCRRSERNGDGS
jgi:hypothetical protein